MNRNSEGLRLDCGPAADALDDGLKKGAEPVKYDIVGESGKAKEQSRTPSLISAQWSFSTSDVWPTPSRRIMMRFTRSSSIRKVTISGLDGRGDSDSDGWYTLPGVSGI